ncbi:MAG: hypothetical protein R3B09_28830 [Nannocystaceae bacterium]
MGEGKQARLRDARDRLVDLLDLGETYPLADLAVTEQIKVPFGASARIQIDPSQAHVDYELRDQHGGGPPAPVVAAGSGAAIELQTPPIGEDRTFTVRAVKAHPRPEGDASERAVFLHGRARVKVGLDVRLPARVRLEGGVTGLGRAALIDHRASVVVAVDGAQEGVDYELVSLEGGQVTPRGVAAIRGTGQGTSIVLRSLPLLEDLELRLRATRTFGQGSSEVALLDVALPVAVRADRSRPTSLLPGPRAAFGSAPRVVIDASQTSVRYRAYARRVDERERVFVGDPSPPGDRLRVDVDAEGRPPVEVVRPPLAAGWAPPPGFVAAGDPIAGTGGALELPLPEAREDQIVLVCAGKEHGADGGSAVELAAALLLLVRPDAAPALTFAVEGAGADGGATVELLGGEVGVYYQLLGAGDLPIGAPVYVHGPPRGLGELRLEVDLAIAGVAPPRALGAPIAVGDALRVRATRALTGLVQDLDGALEVPPLPAIRLGAPTIAAGERASIEVASVVGERYRLLRGDAPVGDAVDGTGQALALLTPPLAASEVVVVEVTRADARLHHRVPIAVEVV